MERKPWAVVVGGSIAGLSCATPTPSSPPAGEPPLSRSPPLLRPGAPAGAGLGVDSHSLRLLCRLIGDPNLLRDATFPLSINLNRVTDSEKKVSRTLTRDDGFNFRAAHWADLHSILLHGLPPETVLWGHQFISFEVPDVSSIKN